MNGEILLLFVNATLVTVISSIVVIAILRKQYLPAIKEMEEHEEEKKQSENEELTSNH